MANPIILYDNRLLDGTLSSSEVMSGFDVNNVIDYRPYTYWVANNSGTNYISVDCVTPKTADCLGIIGHNLYSIGASVSVWSSNNGINWIQRLVFNPTSDKALLKTFTQASARYWKLQIVNTSGQPRIAVVFIGNKLEFPYPPNAPFVPYSESIEVESKRSKTGHLLGSVIKYKQIEISINFSDLTRDWVNTYFKPFWDNHASELKPFFWAWDIDYSSDVFYVTIQDNMKYETPLSMLSYVDKLSLEMRGIKE
jgi:hypothetical protein